MVCSEDILEGKRSSFGIERKPRRVHRGCRDFQVVDEGSVEGEPVMSREGDQLVRVPSATDSVSIAPSRTRPCVEMLKRALLRVVARKKTGSVRKKDGILG